VPRGGTATYTVSITTTGGFGSSVNFAVSGLPPAAVGTFNPNPATGSSVLTVTVSSGASGGTYTLTVTGTGGTPAIQHTATAELVKSQQK
jgi:hypothetical protein